MKKTKKEEAEPLMMLFATLSIGGIVWAEWTHLATTFQAEQYIFMVVGFLVAPIGLINGIGILLGAW
jgi:hypothetical protein